MEDKWKKSTGVKKSRVVTVVPRGHVDVERDFSRFGGRYPLRYHHSFDLG